MKMRVGLMLAVLALDLGTKWAMYDPGLLNQRLGADAWRVPFYAAVLGIFVAGLLLTRGAAGIAFALILGGYLGQMSQLLATGSVSDWLAVGGYWTNVADIAVAAGCALLVLEYGRYVARELAPLRTVGHHES